MDDVLELVDRQVPEPGPGEVRVRVAASGVKSGFAAAASVYCRALSGTVEGLAGGLAAPSPISISV